ncbi:dTMP kinase [Streptomyces olivaceus]|uniref:dTMP kinase n=1 Tax=Streptomyces olivaceus TaxID=47716 RepID=UPI001D172AE6|nr:dTMP kinase [Streptomyces olivaceus]
MLPAWLPSPRTLGALQRVLLVALLTPAALIALTAAVPALTVMPFLAGGTDRAVKLLAAHTRYLHTLLTSSRPAPQKGV